MNRSLAKPYPCVRSGTLSRYLALTKPRLTATALMTTAIGFFMGSQGGMDVSSLCLTIFGAALVGAGCSALNQYLEREVDGRMKRTESRPLPSGQISEYSAAAFGVAAATLGTTTLSFVNLTASLIGAAIVLSYVFVYTPLKKRTILNTLVGAVPGALPAVLGWTAARGAWDIGATALFFILFFWQLPHFFSIAWVYKEDYKKSGLKIPTLGDQEGRRTAFFIFLNSVALFAATIWPFVIGLAGRIYLFSAIFAAAMLLALASHLFIHKMKRARMFIPASVFYLLFVLSAMITDKVR